jgi:hypothetical protein
MKSNTWKFYKFSELFNENPDYSITPKYTIEINGVVLGTNVSFGTGVSFGGLDFHQFKNRELRAKRERDRFIVADQTNQPICNEEKKETKEQNRK